MSDAKAIADALAESLEHMQHCAECAQDSWECCDGGIKAIATLAAYRAQADEPKYRIFDPRDEPIEEGDEWSTDGEYWGRYDKVFFGRRIRESNCTLSRRPIATEGTR